MYRLIQNTSWTNRLCVCVCMLLFMSFGFYWRVNQFGCMGIWKQPSKMKMKKKLCEQTKLIKRNRNTFESNTVTTTNLMSVQEKCLYFFYHCLDFSLLFLFVSIVFGCLLAMQIPPSLSLLPILPLIVDFFFNFNVIPILFTHTSLKLTLSFALGRAISYTFLFWINNHANCNWIWAVYMRSEPSVLFLSFLSSLFLVLFFHSLHYVLVLSAHSLLVHA